MKILIMLGLVFLSACSTVKVAPEEGDSKVPAASFSADDFLNNLSSVNQKLMADLRREPRFKKGLKGITLNDYREKLSTYKSSVAEELSKDLKKFNVLKITGFDRTFVLCGYSATSEFSFCDDPKCLIVEKTKSSKSDETEHLAQSLPVSKCE